MNDDAVQSTDQAPPRRGLRSYHWPFIIAGVCGLALAGMIGIMPRKTMFPPENPFGFFAVCFGFLAAILVYAIPVCLLVLWQWYWSGEPPELDLEPLIPCAERRALYRTWNERPQLDDNAFYEDFYAESGIAKEIVIGVRREMQAILGHSLAGVHPADEMSFAEPDLDFADVLYRFEKTFDTVIPWQTGAIQIDFTFDFLVRLVADCKANKYPVPPPERQTFRKRARYLPFVIGAACMATLVITSNMTIVHWDDAVLWIVVPMTILLLDIPVCVWILWRG